jgi:hypothetical protein
MSSNKFCLEIRIFLQPLTTSISFYQALSPKYPLG